MRTLGILAIFLLTVGAIVEAAFLFRLSRRVGDLSRELAVAHEAPPRPAEPPPLRPPPSRPPVTLPAVRVTAPPAFTPSPAATVANATLRDALATPEGREQLRTALDIIAEQKRQERLVHVVERREERDQRWRERMAKVVPLAPDEATKVNALLASLQTGRRQLLEDMRAGSKDADQTDSALDDLQDSTQKAIRTLIGEERWRKMREGDRRGGGGQQRGPQGQGGQPAAANVPTAPPG
jgi:hypothetical protein